MATRIGRWQVTAYPGWMDDGSGSLAVRRRTVHACQGRRRRERAMYDNTVSLSRRACLGNALDFDFEASVSSSSPRCRFA